MEIFYTSNISDRELFLSKEEHAHCIKVLRHKVGDEIEVIDGNGTLYKTVITAISKAEVVCSIKETVCSFGAHNYNLVMAVSPTKNIDRYEWFIEKATELGVDTIIPIVGDHSERRVIKLERLNKILLSATKQSLKGKIPVLEDVISVKEFLNRDYSKYIKAIAHCSNEGKVTINEIVKSSIDSNNKNILIMIGPEGDFSTAEISAAKERGFCPLTLGSSRLRTETAALAAVSAIYFGLE